MSDTNTTDPDTKTLVVGPWADAPIGGAWNVHDIGIKGSVTDTEVRTMVDPRGMDSTQVVVWLNYDECLLIDTWVGRDTGCLSIGALGQTEDMQVWGGPEHLRQIGVALIGLAARVDAAKG